MVFVAKTWKPGTGMRKVRPALVLPRWSTLLHRFRWELFLSIVPNWSGASLNNNRKEIGVSGYSLLCTRWRLNPFLGSPSLFRSFSNLTSTYPLTSQTPTLERATDECQSPPWRKKSRQPPGLSLPPRVPQSLTRTKLSIRYAWDFADICRSRLAAHTL